MFVKVCGLRSTQEIDWAIKLGYDAIGVVLYPKSRRYMAPAKARELARYAKGKIKSVAVSINFEDIQSIIEDFDYIQIAQGIEDVEVKKRILSVEKKSESLELELVYTIYDASRGLGIYQDFPNWLSSLKGKLILAGGLSPDNVKGVIKKFEPFGVDVSSGVEVEGRKNFNAMQDFIKEVRNART